MNRKTQKVMYVLTIVIPAMVLVAILLMFGRANAQEQLYSQLEIGARGGEVTKLQTFLAADVSVYPEGLVTGYFGALTKAAVARFQTKYGIPAVGRVGPMTLEKINSLIGGGSVGVGTDVSAPIIMNVSVLPVATSTQVTWKTNELAKGKVYYDVLFPALIEAVSRASVSIVNGLSMEEASYGVDHSLTLSNLQSNRTYYYVIQSTDASGNVMYTWPTLFTTK